MKKRIQHTICIDGNFIKVDTPTLEAFTPGLFKGEGVFETLLAIGNKVFDVNEHLKRLKRSFKGAKLSAQTIARVVEANSLDVARVRILAWKEKKVIHSAVIALKYDFPKARPFKVCLIKTNRPASLKFAHKKSLDYQLFAQAYQRAQAAGFDEALLINKKGYIFEACRANVFILKDGQLITPPLSSGCLDGITRRQFMDAAKKMGIPVLEKNVNSAMLKDAQEFYLTNSLLGIKAIKISFTSLPL